MAPAVATAVAAAARPGTVGRRRRRAGGADTASRLVDSAGRPCCGFETRLYHRRTDACELDVLVLAVAFSVDAWRDLAVAAGASLAAPYQSLLRWRRLEAFPR